MHSRKLHNSIVYHKVTTLAASTHTETRKCPELQNPHALPITASYLPQQATNIPDFMVISNIYIKYLNI